MLVLLAAEQGGGTVPSPFWVWPFAAILLAIAILPLIHRTAHWWEHNRHKLLVSLVLAGITLAYYGARGYGVPVHGEAATGHGSEAPAPQPTTAEAIAPLPAAPDLPTLSPEEVHAAGHRSAPGWRTVLAVLEHAVVGEYVPFIVLLFSLYVIAGGIIVRGDIQATPRTNTTILAIGGVLASLIGTTGAAMVLIRLLLKTNQERQRKVHTVVFFIFIVANVGGTLLPTGDPPLFLGYLRGVPFLWTLNLWKEWAFMLAALLVVYYLWDRWAYRHETPGAIRLDVTQIEPLRIGGLVNLIWLLGVVFAVGTMDPAKPFPGTEWHPPMFLREGVQLALVALSLLSTPGGVRAENQFNFVAIGEVACLFIGIFITMQVPIEILQAAGPQMVKAGFVHPWQFFWATGALSSFLDNAPTYVVYFETAVTLEPTGPVVALGERAIDWARLVAISCGAVFMGANTYIGNGPNFMVKTIAEQSGLRMPSFFGYMVYSIGILVPLFVVLTFVFFR